MKVQSNDIEMKLDVDALPRKKNYIQEQVVTYQGNVDWEKNVINKPTFNGKEMVGNVEEEDPSVQAIDLAELNTMFNSIFKNEG